MNLHYHSKTFYYFENRFYFGQDGLTYTYPKNSHTILITGVDELYYYINDPLKKEKNLLIPKEKLEKSYDSMGRQLILFKKK